MKKLFLGGNGYTLRRHMQTISGAPATGLVLTGFLSATPTGAAIHSSLSLPLTEVGTEGLYRVYEADLDPDDLVTHLTLYDKKTIYDCATGTGYDDRERILVDATRLAGEP